MKFLLTIASIAAAILLALYLTGKQDTEIRLGVIDPKTEVQSKHLTFEHDGHQFVRSRNDTRYFIHHPSCKLCAQKEVK